MTEKKIPVHLERRPEFIEIIDEEKLPPKWWHGSRESKLCNEPVLGTKGEKHDERE